MNRHYDAAVFAARNRNVVYDEVIGAIEHAAKTRGVTRKQIAENIGRKPSQVSKWLSGPSNWTLDTVSDLLRGVGATMKYQVIFDEDQPRSNVFNSASAISLATATSHPTGAMMTNAKNFVTPTSTTIRGSGVLNIVKVSATEAA